MTESNPDVVKKKSSSIVSRLETLSSGSCDQCGAPLTLIRFMVFDEEVTLRPACECRIRALEEREKQARLDELHRALRHQGLEEGLYARMSLEKWKCRDGSSEAAVKSLESYFRSVWPGARNWLYLFGGYGLGKTHLGVSTLKYLCLQRQWESLLLKWSEYCSRVQQSWHEPNGGFEYDLGYKAANVTLLVLDDIDKRTSSEWALGKLFELIDQRYLHQLPTVLIANRGIEELSAYWEKTEQMRDLAGAIISRIVGQLSAVIEFSGRDYRLSGP